MRVQIPAYTDAWMKGDRYGTVLSGTPIRPYGKKSKVAGAIVYTVLLDKSNKTIKVPAADCQEI